MEMLSSFLEQLFPGSVNEQLSSHLNATISVHQRFQEGQKKLFPSIFLHCLAVYAQAHWDQYLKSFEDSLV